jgi:hypothetical protein
MAALMRVLMKVTRSLHKRSLRYCFILSDLGLLKIISPFYCFLYLQNSAPSGAAKAATKVSKKESSSDEDDGSSDESSDDEEESEPTKTPKKKVWFLKPFVLKLREWL